MLWYFFGRVAHLNPKQYINLTRYRHEFGERQKEGQQWFGYKLHWSEQRKSVVLVAGPIGLEQKDPSSNKVPDNGDLEYFNGTVILHLHCTSYRCWQLTSTRTSMGWLRFQITLVALW